MNRYIVAYLWDCGDPECNCRQVLVEERSWSGDGEHSEPIHEGTFASDPSPAELAMMYEELEELAARHRLERETRDGHTWSREL